MNNKTAKLGSLLIQYGLITEDDLNDGLKLQKLMGLKLGETLIKIGKITEENVQWVLSKQFDIPFIILEHVNPDSDLIVKLPKNFLMENRILPLFETDEEICIVTEDIFNYSAFALIENTLNKKVNISLGEGKKIEKALIKFFKSDAMPSLLSTLENIIEKIKNTSFYRIDIAISNHSCDISIYGCGILKKISKINNSLKKEDVLRAFDFLKIPFLYDIHENYSKVIFSVFPLINKTKEINYPAILELYGLLLPDFIIFADTNSSDTPNLLYSDSPIHGYPYISIKSRILNYSKAIYTLDSAPQTFKKHYIKVYMPQECSFCSTEGCEKCNELGYTFKKIEGIYDSEDLNTILNRSA